MARKSLKPQLNQIRAWVRQGRTDAWIAHQLEVSASQLRDFRRRHGLDAEGEEPASDVDLRDEIEAELDEAAEPDEEDEEAADEDAEDEDAPKPKRRRRRGGRGRGRGRKKELEATFDHGQKDGYGLWLDPAVRDDPAYAEHWAEVRALKVTIEPDRIMLERADDARGDDD